jgi:hypothetical protein
LTLVDEQFEYEHEQLGEKKRRDYVVELFVPRETDGAEAKT